MSTQRLVLSTAVAAVLAAAGFFACPASATPIVSLNSGNSHLEFDTGTPAGLYQWRVDGVNHLSQQWLWYRIGGSGPEYSISTLTQTASYTSDSDGDGLADTLYLKYAQTNPEGPAGFSIDLSFLLTGGTAGSRESYLAQTLRVTNTGSGTLDLHLFQYVDFNLGGSGASDTAKVTGGNTAGQKDLGMYLAEEVAVPSPNHYQVGFAADLLAGLTDGAATVLTGSAGPITGDAAWAFQWDRNLAPGESLILSKNESIVPEPATFALMAAGFAATIGIRRKRRT